MTVTPRQGGAQNLRLHIHSVSRLAMWVSDDGYTKGIALQFPKLFIRGVNRGDTKIVLFGT